MIKDFGNVCVARKNADVIERNCEEVLQAITHKPMTASEIAKRGDIMREDYNYDERDNSWHQVFVPNYQRVANEAKILIALGLVKKTIEEWEEEIEFPACKRNIMIADEMNGNEIVSWHWEYVDAPAGKQTFKRSRTLYSLAD